MNIAGGVFVLKDENTLVPMQPASFASEDDFQRLLASFPALLAGDQIDVASPRRFTLVSREEAISDQEGGSARWSLDHLFLDQDGIPTLVEVKRSTDTRIRREVVGQMLDYAANSILHWPVEELRTRFSLTCEAAGRKEGSVLGELLSSDPETTDAEAFWAQVKTNLFAGRVRLIFVADRIPAELRRVVEFLNRQMQPAEVLAVELRQFEGQGLKTLVPIVLGQTQEAAQKKTGGSVTSKRHWDEASFMAELAESKPGEPDLVACAGRLLDWSREHADSVDYNTNARSGSFGPVLIRDGIALSGPFRVWTSGILELKFQQLPNRPVFSEPALRSELGQRLGRILGMSLSEASGRPTLPLRALCVDGVLLAFLEVMGWFVDTYRGTSRDRQ